jgi:pimeloyl-ACP methyl ester carboxylesterase
MPFAEGGGVRIYFEDTGEGVPIIWSHEYAGDYRSWALQVGYFSRSHRTIVYNHRGYPPSGVPVDEDEYSQDHLIEDLRALVEQLGITSAHFVGLSMGANVVLNLALRYPGLCRSVVFASGGSGTVQREAFEAQGQRLIQGLREHGMASAVEELSAGPTRTPFLRKDPRGFALFQSELAEHSVEGMANIYRGVQLRRPTIFQLKDKLNDLRVPTLVMVGDEDDPCLEPALFLKREIPGARLCVIPDTGHCVNLEEPALFNAYVQDFFTSVDRGTWKR